MKLSDQEFDDAVKRAIKRIPREIRRHLKNVFISVKKRPSKEMMKEMGYSSDHLLLGLYVGASLMERSETYPPLYPDTIFIFQEPLEKISRTIKELENEIEITVVHEVAHFIGLSEDELAELGYE